MASTANTGSVEQLAGLSSSSVPVYGYSETWCSRSFARAGASSHRLDANAALTREARMPRLPRLHVPGGCYHVILRDNHEGGALDTQRISGSIA
jgi:hypothetical protein